MKIRVYSPENENKNIAFKRRIAKEHINMMKEYIDELSLSEEETYMIWMKIQLEIKQRAKKVFPR